tara:strand:- start:334 stop:816 length:483 start_codon:yes stop_codon:yes gene_type:complete
MAGLGIPKYLMQRLKPGEQTVKAKPSISQERFERLPKKVQQGVATKWGRNLRGTLLERINKGWKAGQEKTSRLRWDAAIYGRGKRLVVDQNKLKLIPVKYGGKQVLSTVGRAIGVTSGWGTLIAGVSLLAQTKRAKKFRADLQGTRPQKIKHFPAQRKNN